MNNNRYVLSLMCLALAIIVVPGSIKGAEVKQKVAAQEALASAEPVWTPEKLKRALPYWIKYGEISSVKYALQNGIDIDMQYYDGETMLMDAVSRHQLAMVEFLLERGANVNIQSDSGTTALMEAARFEEKDDIAQLLLDYGANVLLKNNDEQTAYDIALATGREEVAKLLEPLILAPIKRKLKHKAIINKQDQKIKAEKKKAEQLQTLFPIWARDGDEENVKRALDNGINIDAKDDSGNTALIEAASGGQVEMINLLLAKGAHINAKNNRGDTALMNAAKEGHDLAVEMLLNKGAAIELKNNADDTAYDIAKEHGYEDIALLLKQWARAKDRARMERGTV